MVASRGLSCHNDLVTQVLNREYEELREGDNQGHGAGEKRGAAGARGALRQGGAPGCSMTHGLSRGRSHYYRYHKESRTTIPLAVRRSCRNRPSHPTP